MTETPEGLYGQPYEAPTPNLDRAEKLIVYAEQLAGINFPDNAGFPDFLFEW